MAQQEKILVILDPFQDEHIALDRALITSRLRNPRPVVHVFIGVDMAAKKLKSDSPALSRNFGWINGLLAPLRDEGLSVTVDVCWSPQWQQAVLRTAEYIGADLIVVPDYSSRDNTHFFFSEAKWGLLRRAHCPVLIVRPGASTQRKTVLAALNMLTNNPRYEELNRKILARGQWMANRYNADFHVVNAYSDSLHYPDRGQIARRTGLVPESIHIKRGEPETVIAETARELSADVVVIGTQARQGVLGLMRGNTSEKVLDKLSQDVMTLN